MKSQTKALGQFPDSYLAIYPFATPQPEQLSLEEKGIFDSFPSQKRQKEWFAGRKAAHLALAAAGAAKLSVLKDPEGKPVLTGPEADNYQVTITHGKGFAAAIATRSGQAQLCLGVDLVDQSDLRRLQRIKKRVFTTQELAWSEDRPEVMKLCWGLKEAAAKATRTGMFVFALSQCWVEDFDWPGGWAQCNLPGAKAEFQILGDSLLVIVGLPVDEVNRIQKRVLASG